MAFLTCPHFVDDTASQDGFLKVIEQFTQSMDGFHNNSVRFLLPKSLTTTSAPHRDLLSSSSLSGMT